MRGFTDAQKKCLEIYEACIAAWLEDGQFLDMHAVICEDGIKAAFFNFGDAFDYAASNLEKGSFIIQQIRDEGKINNFLYPAL